jgi:hypothetical protein
MSSKCVRCLCFTNIGNTYSGVRYPEWVGKGLWCDAGAGTMWQSRAPIFAGVTTFWTNPEALQHSEKTVMTLANLSNDSKSYLRRRVRGGTADWGISLQAGRLRIRFPMGSLGLFIDLILPAAPEVNSVCHGNENQGYSLGSKDDRSVRPTALPSSRAECLERLGASASRGPKGIASPFNYEGRNGQGWW